jgi:hypothetical protein
MKAARKINMVNITYKMNFFKHRAADKKIIKIAFNMHCEVNYFITDLFSDIV